MIEQLTIDGAPEAVTRWTVRAGIALALFRSQGRHFTAADLEAHAGSPDDRNAVGAWFHAQARAGHIHVCGYEKSPIASRKGGLIRVWQAT